VRYVFRVIDRCFLITCFPLSLLVVRDVFSASPGNDMDSKNKFLVFILFLFCLRKMVHSFFAALRRGFFRPIGLQCRRSLFWD
jgi:hypothetical protein